MLAEADPGVLYDGIAVSPGMTFTIMMSLSSNGTLSWSLPILDFSTSMSAYASSPLARWKDSWTVFAGYFMGTANIGGTMLTAQGDGDTFLVYIDDQGLIDGARTLGFNSLPHGLAADANHLWMSGTFNEPTINFGGGSVPNPSMVSSSGFLLSRGP